MVCTWCSAGQTSDSRYKKYQYEGFIHGIGVAARRRTVAADVVQFVVMVRMMILCKNPAFMPIVVHVDISYWSINTDMYDMILFLQTNTCGAISYYGAVPT